MEVARWKVRTYCFTARHHGAVRAAWGLLLLGSAWLALGLRWTRLPPAGLPPAGRWAAAGAAAALLLAGMVLLAVWPGFSAWYGWRFRYLAWWSARALASVRRGIELAAGGALVLLLIVATGLSRPRLPAVAEVAAAALGIALLSSALRLRRRLVVVPFTSFGGAGKEDEELAGGLAARLHAQLSGTLGLYKVIDEAFTATPVSGVFSLSLNNQAASKALEGVVSLNAQDAREEFEGVVGPDAKLSFGFFQLPVGALLERSPAWCRAPASPAACTAPATIA